MCLWLCACVSGYFSGCVCVCVCVCARGFWCVLVCVCVCACCVFLGTEAVLAHDSRSSSRVVRVCVCMLVCVGARGFVCACVRVCCVRVTLCCVADKLPLA